jgi:phosphoribosyl-dephospho-CoA transferase
MNPVEWPYPFRCFVCGRKTTVVARGRYNAMDKLEATTGWRIRPRNSLYAKVYCSEHAVEENR